MVWAYEWSGTWLVRFFCSRSFLFRLLTGTDAIENEERLLLKIRKLLFTRDVAIMGAPGLDEALPLCKMKEFQVTV